MSPNERERFCRYQGAVVRRRFDGCLGIAVERVPADRDGTESQWGRAFDRPPGPVTRLADADLALGLLEVDLDRPTRRESAMNSTVDCSGSVESRKIGAGSRHSHRGVVSQMPKGVGERGTRAK
jgi:hypothetical protein